MAERNDEPRRIRAEDLDEDELIGPRRRARARAAEEVPTRARSRPYFDDEEDEVPRSVSAPRLRRKAGGGSDRETLLAVVRDIPNFLKLLGRLARDPRVSVVDKAIVGAAIAYLVVPTDIIPDFLGPVIGQVEDIYLLGLALSRLLNNAGIELLLEHWDGEMASLETALSTLDRASSILPDRVRSLLGAARA